VKRLLAAPALLILIGLFCAWPGPATAAPVDNKGQAPAGSRRAVAVIHGQTFGIYYAGGTKSFVLEKNETRGTIDYLAILRWLHAHHALASSDTLWQFNFRWEVCDTGGKARTFTLRSLTLHQKF
jgi:hypothetical protein